MDNNQKVLNTQPDPLVSTQPPQGEGNKMVLWFIAGLLVIILVVGGVYWYLSNKQKTPPTTQAPTTKVEENLEKDLDSVNVEEVDTSSVDSDLQSL